MTDTNIIDRQPSKFDYASPIQFRFKMTKLPNVEFFVQTANIPGIALDEVQQPTRLKAIALPGSTLTFQNLDLSFLVDENLNNEDPWHSGNIHLAGKIYNSAANEIIDVELVPMGKTVLRKVTFAVND